MLTLRHGSSARELRADSRRTTVLESLLGPLEFVAAVREPAPSGSPGLPGAYDEAAALRQTLDLDAMKSLRFMAPALAVVLLCEALVHLSSGGLEALAVVPLAWAICLILLTWAAWRQDDLPHPAAWSLLPWLAALVSIVQHLQIGQGAGTVLFLAVMLVVSAFSFPGAVTGSIVVISSSLVFVWASLQVFEDLAWLYPTLIVPLAVGVRWRRVAGLREAERRRWMERELVRRDEELAGLRRLRGVTAGVAHHYNNLLTVMIGSASILEKEIRDPMARLHVAEVLAAGQRASELAQGLLATVGEGARAEATEFEVADLVEQVSKRGRDLDDVVIRSEVGADLPRIYNDFRLVCRALDHLIENAVEACGSKGCVLVRFSCRQPDRLRVEVLDSGPGFTPEALARAFDPFWTTRDPSRTGLGLACARGLIGAIGGTAEVANRLDRSGGRAVLEVPVRLDLR